MALPPVWMIALACGGFCLASRSTAAFITPLHTPRPQRRRLSSSSSCTSSLYLVPPDVASSSSLIADEPIIQLDILANSIASSLPNAAAAASLSVESDPFKYLFMLPTATLVATSCQLAGIGGAALFSPIFLLIFPLLGPEYPLPSAASAVASALLTECFGFASGLFGYSRRGLVDWTVALQFMATSIPASLVGALGAKYLAGSPILLRAAYAALMLGLAAFLLLSPRPEALERFAAEEECDVPELDDGTSVNLFGLGFGEKKSKQTNSKEEAFDPKKGLRTTVAADGTEFTYLEPRRGSKKGVSATVGGGVLTGLLGVGVGEVILPQLVRGCCMPLPVAAGTSVAIVVVTALTAAFVQFVNLAAGIEGSLVEGLIKVVPIDLVRFTIPGVLIGGQLAPFLASKGWLSDEAIETFAAALFGLVGIAFAIKAVVG